MVWWPFAPKPERADTLEVTDLHSGAPPLYSTVVNYEQAVEPFRLTDRLSESERATLMGGACAKAYGWLPKKG
jgi:hypothetical protein